MRPGGRRRTVTVHFAVFYNTENVLCLANLQSAPLPSELHLLLLLHLRRRRRRSFITTPDGRKSANKQVADASVIQLFFQSSSSLQSCPSPRSSPPSSPGCSPTLHSSTNLRIRQQLMCRWRAWYFCIHHHMFKM